MREANPRQPMRSWRLLRVLAAACAVAVLLAGCVELLPLDLPTPAPSGQSSLSGQPQLLIAMLDVGQGDSILVGSDGYYLLVDAGDNTQGDDVLQALADMGVQRLAAVVGTHPDSDHIGGLDTVIDGMDVDAVYMSALESNTRTYEDLLDAIDRRGLTVTVPKPGQEIQLGSAVVRFLWPPRGHQDSQDNNHSIVLRVSGAGHTALLTGDIEKRAEKALLQSGENVDCDILKVAHHGSASSSSQAFLDEAQPVIALIGVGAGNDYGHPKADVLRRLDGIGAHVYRTDRNGAISIAVIDGELTIVTER